MPYIGLEEPVRVAVDEPAGLQRLDFYDGGSSDHHPSGP
jgi:hypothetical protein